MRPFPDGLLSHSPNPFIRAGGRFNLRPLEPRLRIPSNKHRDDVHQHPHVMIYLLMLLLGNYQWGYGILMPLLLN